MSRCIRCKRPGTVVVHETSGGSVTGPNGANGSGPLTGRVYACDEHGEQIRREDEAVRRRVRGQ